MLLKFGYNFLIYISNIDKFYNLKKIDCGNNGKLKELPLLPNSLEILYCCDNKNNTIITLFTETTKTESGSESQ